MDDTDDKKEKAAVSRRAFLKSAGTKALSTGATIVPGLAVANAAMEKARAAEAEKAAAPDEATAAAETPDVSPEHPVKRLRRLFLKRRKG